MQIALADRLHEVDITYKKIRNMYLRVDADGTLHVSCSRRTTLKQIEQFILAKEDWILKTQQKQQIRSSAAECGIGGSATWLGRRYPVELMIASRASLKVAEDRIILHVREDTDEEIQRVFYTYGARKIAEMIEERRGQWDKDICLRYRLPFPQISVRYMTGRWGSCTPAKASIRMSSRLIHYPSVCLDYVLLHEYVHFLVPDHSAAFYREVQKRMPQYKQYDALLK